MFQTFKEPYVDLCQLFNTLNAITIFKGLGNGKDAEVGRILELVVKPKVDAFCAWVKDTMPKVSAGSNTYKSLQYCINQEKFLRVFLSNGAVPMDNNVAERAIRPFTLGRKAKRG